MAKNKDLKKIPTITDLYDWFGNPEKGTLETITETPTDTVEKDLQVIKIFVDPQGNIEKRYSLFQKVKLGFLWKVHKKKYFSEKKRIDNKIITKYANNKVTETYFLIHKKRNQIKELETEHNNYIKKIKDMKKEFSYIDDKKYFDLDKEIKSKIDEFNETNKKKILNNEKLDLIVTDNVVFNENILKLKEFSDPEKKQEYLKKIRFEYLNLCKIKTERKINDCNKEFEELGKTHEDYCNNFTFWQHENIQRL